MRKILVSLAFLIILRIFFFHSKNSDGNYTSKKLYVRRHGYILEKNDYTNYFAGTLTYRIYTKTCTERRYWARNSTFIISDNLNFFHSVRTKASHEIYLFICCFIISQFHLSRLSHFSRGFNPIYPYESRLRSRFYPRFREIRSFPQLCSTFCGPPVTRK